ncbi:MAG: hypothetical protein U5R06_12730 [candidate division KSB1 bacterium]|nr:hypothetical protein [candidate division KSB1 bacterium]
MELYLRYDHSLSITQNLDRHRKEMEKLAELNKSLQIRGAYQNHAGNAMGKPFWDLWFLLRDLDPDWIGCRSTSTCRDRGRIFMATGYAVVYSANYIEDTVIKDCIWKKKQGEWRHHSVPLQWYGRVDSQPD